MFEAFVQGDRKSEGRQTGGNVGLGLGLALVKRLTEMQGGTVSAASAGPGQGAHFTVRLPAVARPAASASTVAPGPTASRRVLIIEDNDDARHMLQLALSRRGHAVSVARDGASGLALVAQIHPEVALIDIGLPDIDGFELARRLRAGKDGRSMRLIALSGRGEGDDRRKALGAGFDLYLIKPVAPERLSQTIAELH
jgi:CheY-like chemotaxis protein